MIELKLFHNVLYSEKYLCPENQTPFKQSRVAQWKRAGPITQRSVDRNHALLYQSVFKFFYLIDSLINFEKVDKVRHEFF